MTTSFGKYSDLVTSLITAFLVVTAVLSHIFEPTIDLTFVDAAALLALGRIYGQVSAANGYAGMAIAANKRVDVIEHHLNISTNPNGTIVTTTNPDGTPKVG